ncbi:glycerol ether metabolic process [Coemansia erecta]|uniref:Thioredoxin n=1 Tax=Coemansia asiatica TaxID=1052880 RepID=A0A9W7XR96_9FUNG|nr:glycerol ether metabolic process [Coemansia asiatica]KAJ2838233.1 glycerol ether metabolic process [Coemansia erecta]
MAVRSVKSKKEFKEILDNVSKVAVDFNASWCGSCKAMNPIFEKLAKDHSDITFLSVDVDEASELAQEQEITSMPTFKFFDNGKAVDTVVGAKKQALEHSMDSFCS